MRVLGLEIRKIRPAPDRIEYDTNANLRTLYARDGRFVTGVRRSLYNLLDQKEYVRILVELRRWDVANANEEYANQTRTLVLHSFVADTEADEFLVNERRLLDPNMTAADAIEEAVNEFHYLREKFSRGGKEEE